MAMRSELIHGALRPVGNRFTLCQLASKATRKFHRPNTRIQETMNEIFNKLSKIEGPERVMTFPEKRAEKLAESHRQAA